MSDKLLYTIGNLSAGNTIYGVEAEREFGTLDVYGPFRENEANTFAHKLVEDHNPLDVEHRYVSVKVVRIETPQAGTRIVRNSGGGYEYAV
jgi:hypothetical protein